MKTPVFCINRLRYFRTVIFAANAMFAILCLLTIFPFADSTNRASAEVNGDEYSLTLAMTDDVTLSFNPTDEGVLRATKATITGSTNAPTGYQLYISSATDDDNSFLLEGEESNSARADSKMQAISGTFIAPEALFTSQDTPATWGYAIPGLGGFDASYSSVSNSSKFAAVPTAGNGQLIHEATTAVSGDTVDIYYGAKVNSRLRHGKYKTWIKYTAVTDMTSEVTEGISIFPHRIRNNYEHGTTVTVTSETRIASDLGVLIATVNNEPCTNIIKTSDSPLTFTCEIPDGLTNGEYDVVLEIPQYGKSFTSTNKLKIVDPYDVMQEIDKEIYDSVLTDQQYQFIDSRDDKKYYITKLKNGDLAMTQNLDFELSTDGTTLNPETSDVNSTKTISKTNATIIDNGSSVTKYSYTKNYNQDGAMSGNLEGVWNNTMIRGSGRDEGSEEAHVITIPGATELSVEIYYASDWSNYGTIYLRKGKNTDGNYIDSLYSYCYNVSYTVNNNVYTNVCKRTYTVQGDSINISLWGYYWESNYSKGYYAIIKGNGFSYESDQKNNPEAYFQYHIDDSEEDAHLNRGSVYSLSSALTAPITENMEPTESICPSGWHLDNYADYKDSIIGQYGDTSRGSGTISIQSSPLYLLGGNYYGLNFSGIRVSNNGSVTTTVASAEQAYSEVTSGDNLLQYIRCIYNAPQRYSLSYSANGGSNPPEEQFFGGWEDTSAHTFKINSSVPSREGSTFKGWSENPNATEADYQPGDSFVATDQHTLYAIWTDVYNYFDAAFEAAGKTKTNGYYAMQDMTNEICASVPKLISEYEANTTQLIDLRDNKIYFVSKLQDGKCWMTQNLSLELDSEGIVLDPTTSSVASPQAISSADFEEGQTYHQNYGNTMINDFYGSVDINSVASSLSDPLLHYLVGSSYIYPAATAKIGQPNVMFSSASSSTIIDNDEIIEEEPTPDSFNATPKYSHTSNFADDGTRLSTASVLWSNKSIRGTDRTTESTSRHTITFPGAQSLNVVLYYYTGSSNNINVYTSAGNKAQGVTNSSACSSGLVLNGTALVDFCTTSFTVSGNTASFELYSSYSGYGRGYYAVVTPRRMADGDGGQDYYPPNNEPVKSPSVAYSRTQNIDSKGRRLSGYESGWNNSNIVGTGKSSGTDAHSVCLSGYDYLSVELYYSTYNSSDYVTVFNGNGLSYSYYGHSSTGSYDVNGTTISNVDKVYLTFPGNCVKFSFYSYYNGADYYGYYAIVKGGKIDYSTNKKIGTKYSYTANLDQTAKKITDYGNNWGNSSILGSTRGDTNNAHVVTIPGASLLLVDVFYSTKSVDSDYVSIWSGSAGSYNAKENSGSSTSGKLGGPQYGSYSLNGNLLNNMGHKQYIINGNTATFSFTSSSGNFSGDGYGYYAMVTGYGTVTKTNTKQTVVQESICPKGWRLPHVLNIDNNEVAKILPEGGYTSAAIRRYFTNQPLFYTDTEAPINYINDNSNEPIINTINNEYTHDNTALGFVRCVAEETYPFAITFDANGKTADVPATIHALFTDDEAKSIMIPINDISYPGNKFLGWSKNQDSTVAEYLPGMYYTFDSASIQLYAVWHEVGTFEEAFSMMNKTPVDGEHYAMQDLDEQICGLLPAYSGTLITSTLIDTRDNKLYDVAKLKDGHCWMIQDLAFATGEGVTLSPATSDTLIERAATIAPIVNENGTYYTYEAATAGFGRGLRTQMTGDSLANMNIMNSPADSEGTICPKGWTLPSAFETNYSYTALLTAYEDDYTALINDFSPNLNGVLDTSGEEPTLISTMSGYWSPKLAQLYKSFNLAFTDNDPTLLVSQRNYAMNVRCIASDNATAKKVKPTLANLGSLQGITQDIINNTYTGLLVSGVIDERDYNDGTGPTYSAVKMPDGKIWMTSSLRYEHEDGTVLDPYTSDVPTEITFSTADDEKSYVITTPSSKYMNGGDTYDEREEGTYDSSTLGYYYSYDYATVNNNDGYSICPAGWQLPTVDMFNSYLSSYGVATNSNNTSTTVLTGDGLPKLNLGGYFTGQLQGDEFEDPQGVGEEGLFWTSNRISNRNARVLWFNKHAINSAYPLARDSAAQVRCVSK